jgi:predicted PurR-regulated permease PerM
MSLNQNSNPTQSTLTRAYIASSSKLHNQLYPLKDLLLNPQANLQDSITLFQESNQLNILKLTKTLSQSLTTQECEEAQEDLQTILNNIFFFFFFFFFIMFLNKKCKLHQVKLIGFL